MDQTHCKRAGRAWEQKSGKSVLAQKDNRGSHHLVITLLESMPEECRCSFSPLANRNPQTLADLNGAPAAAATLWSWQGSGKPMTVPMQKPWLAVEASFVEQLLRSMSSATWFSASQASTSLFA